MELNITHGVLVGINKYKRRKGFGEMDLRGCVNDRNAVKKSLKSKGVKIRLLSNSRASSKAILKKLRWMLEELPVGATGVFYYSGHGTQYYDMDGDEADELDEGLCCYKTMFGDILYDDEIRDYINKYKKEGTQILLIFDCCHSGTQVSNIPDWVTKFDGIKKSVNIRNLNIKAKDKPTDLSKEDSKNVIVWSGCKDSQYSYEVLIKNKSHRGIFTYFTEANLKKIRKGKMSLQDAHNELLEEIKKLGYNQTPQLNFY